MSTNYFVTEIQLPLLLYCNFRQSASTTMTATRSRKEDPSTAERYPLGWPPASKPTPRRQHRIETGPMRRVRKARRGPLPHDRWSHNGTGRFQQDQVRRLRRPFTSKYPSLCCTTRWNPLRRERTTFRLRCPWMCCQLCIAISSSSSRRSQQQKAALWAGRRGESGSPARALPRDSEHPIHSI